MSRAMAAKLGNIDPMVLLCGQEISGRWNRLRGHDERHRARLPGMTGSAARQQRSSLTSSWRLDNSPSKSRADESRQSTLFWAAHICGPMQHLDAHRLRPGLALELERLALDRIEVRSLADFDSDRHAGGRRRVPLVVVGYFG